MLNTLKITRKIFEELVFSIRFNLLNTSDLRIIFDIINNSIGFTNKKGQHLGSTRIILNQSWWKQFRTYSIPILIDNEEYITKLIENENELEQRYQIICNYYKYKLDLFLKYDQTKINTYPKILKQIKTKIKKNYFIQVVLH